MSTTVRADPQTPPAPGERDLVRRLTHVIAEAEDVLGTEFALADIKTRGAEEAGEVLPGIALTTLDRLRALKKGHPQVQPLCDLAVRVADLEVDLREHGVQRRKRALAGVEVGLSRLRSMTTSAELVDNVCQELVRSCGFSRALLSRVEDHTWIPWVLHFAHRDVRDSDREWIAKKRIPLSSMMLENELLKERHAAYVIDAANDERADKSFVAETGATSYVAAPVMPAGRVVGFLHADHYPSDIKVDRVDRDILWAFAEGYGRIYERTVLLERLNAQRDHVRETLRNAEALMDRLAHGELELARHEADRSIASTATTLTLAGERGAMDDLFTPRESEVLALIVAGQSNGAIASRLVISEGTVKSHVKQILRKIGAANRSEAIARYLGMISSG